MDKKTFQYLVKKYYPNINQKAFDLFDSYLNFLTQKNKELNLTRLDKPELIYGSYLYDSIIPYKTLDFNNIKIILDIGSGSGIPGIALKIIFPNLHLTIIESNNKKVKFLNELVKHLNLTNVTVINKRAEEIKEDEYETFDLVTSRAVADVKTILEISVGYLKVNGILVIPKSKNYLNEMKNINYLLKELSLKELKHEHFISENNYTHNVLIYTKVKKTNRKYPRSWSQIIKNK